MHDNRLCLLCSQFHLRYISFPFQSCSSLRKTSWQSSVSRKPGYNLLKRSVEEIFKDFGARHVGIDRALTSGEPLCPFNFITCLSISGLKLGFLLPPSVQMWTNFMDSVNQKRIICVYTNILMKHGKSTPLLRKFLLNSQN